MTGAADRATESAGENPHAIASDATMTRRRRTTRMTAICAFFLIIYCPDFNYSAIFQRFVERQVARLGRGHRGGADREAATRAPAPAREALAGRQLAVLSAA